MRATMGTVAVSLRVVGVCTLNNGGAPVDYVLGRPIWEKAHVPLGNPRRPDARSRWRAALDKDDTRAGQGTPVRGNHAQILASSSGPRAKGVLTLERVLAFGVLTWTLGIILAVFNQADQLSRTSVIGVLLLLGLLAFIAALVLIVPRVRPATTEHVLVEAAVCDPLTGLPNERYLLLRLEEEMARAHRDERPLALAVIDVNGLAVINEQHGRDSGDEVLRHVARVLESTKRASDIVARLGDDEFAVILSECTNEGAQAFVHRLTERLAKEPAGALIEGRPSHIWVGVCAGLADMWPDQEAPANFLDRARAALADDREEREHRRHLWRTA